MAFFNSYVNKSSPFDDFRQKPPFTIIYMGFSQVNRLPRPFMNDFPTVFMDFPRETLLALAWLRQFLGPEPRELAHGPGGRAGPVLGARHVVEKTTQVFVPRNGAGFDVF